MKLKETSLNYISNKRFSVLLEERLSFFSLYKTIIKLLANEEAIKEPAATPAKNKKKKSSEESGNQF